MLAPTCKQYEQSPSIQEEKTDEHMRREYKSVMDEDIIVNLPENELYMNLSNLDIMHYYNSEGVDVVSCFDEQPFVCVSSIERGGTIQRYKVAIANEVYDLKVLHVKNKCPVPLSSYYKGGFGRVEQLSIQGFNVVKKIIRVEYPDQTPTQKAQQQKEAKKKNSNEPINNQEAPKQLSLTITQILREYCITKLAGAYGFGPQVLKSGDFDLIFYADYAEFVLEACIPLVQHLRTKADRMDCENIKKRLKHCILHMHKHRLVHLDIKPQNFLYSPNKKNYVLSDFGTARAVPNEAGTQTSHKSNICSQDYSSYQFLEKADGKKSVPIDLYYQDSTGLDKTFDNINDWAAEKNIFYPVRKYPPPADAVSDRQSVERLVFQLSCFSRGQRPPFLDKYPLPNSYEWIAQYYPQFKNCRMDEPQLPREICLLERAISLNFNLLDYSYPLQISPKTMEIQMAFETEAYGGDTLKRLEFCSQKYHLGRLLERMKTRVDDSNIKVWLAFIDFQMLNPTMYTIEDIKRFYLNIEKFRKQDLSVQNMTMWRIAQEISMKQFYINVLERNISLQEMERFTQETWFGPPESLFNEKPIEYQVDLERSRETIGPERHESVPESYRPLDNYDLNGYQEPVDDRLNRGQYSEYVQNQGLPNLSISSISSNKGVIAYSDEQRKERIEASYAMLVALLFSKKEYERSRYLIGKISNPDLKRHLVFTKLQLEERLYGCKATLRLVKKQLQQARQEITMDQQLVVVLSSRLLALKDRGRDYPAEKTPEQYSAAPYHHLREQATRYYSAGNYEKSMELFKQCAFTVRLNDPRSETYYYELLAWQGQLLVLLGEEREGFALLNRATEAVRMSEGPKSHKLAICYIQFGKSYKALEGDPEALIKAIRYFKDAIDILEEQPPRCCMSFIEAIKEKGSCHELLYSRHSMEQNLGEGVRTHQKALLYPMYKTLADMAFRTQIYEALSVGYFRQKQWNQSLRCMLKHFQTFELLKNNGGYRQGMVTPAQTVRKLNYLLICCVNLHGNLQKIINVRRKISRNLKMFAAIHEFANKDRQELIKKEKTPFAGGDLVKLLWDMLDEIKNSGFKNLKDLAKAKRLRMLCLIIKPSNAELVDPKLQQEFAASIKKHKFQ